MFRRNIGTEAVLKVRCSQGLRPAFYYGACSNRSGQDVDLPLIDSDKSITVSLVRGARALFLCGVQRRAVVRPTVCLFRDVMRVCSLLLSALADQIHDGPAMKPGTEVYLQCAMVYTNGMLKRRIRVHTLAVPVSADIGVVFRHLDLDTVTNVMLKNGESSGWMFNKRDDFRVCPCTHTPD